MVAVPGGERMTMRSEASSSPRGSGTGQAPQSSGHCPKPTRAQAFEQRSQAQGGILRNVSRASS